MGFARLEGKNPRNTGHMPGFFHGAGPQKARTGFNACAYRVLVQFEMSCDEGELFMHIREEVLFLSEQDVLRLFSAQDAIAAAEDTFYHIGTGEITVGTMALMYVDQEKGNNFHSMPAILHHRDVSGVKWIDTYASPQPGYPFSHGNLVIVSDTVTGSPIAIVGATNITNMRTAGGHGVVQARALCNPNPEVLSVIGCGAQAQAGMRGFLAGFPSLRQIRLFSRSRAPMEAMQRELSGRLEVVLCGSPQEAVGGSSLILMASGAVTPLVTWDMLAPGATVIGIEGFRDMDPAIGKKADKWYLGYMPPDQVILESPALNPGHTLCREDVFGDMTQLLTGKIPGRERADEIIVSTHMGMGAHDVNSAYTIYLRAKEQGIGTKLVLDSGC